MCIYEFLLIKGPEDNGTLNKVLSFFTDDLFPAIKDYPKDFNWQLSHGYFYGTIDTVESIGKIFMPNDITVFRNLVQQIEKLPSTSELISFEFPTYGPPGYPILSHFWDERAWIKKTSSHSPPLNQRT